LTSVKCASDSFLNFNCAVLLIDLQGSPGNSIRGAPGPPGIGIKGECQVVNTITKEEVRVTSPLKLIGMENLELFIEPERKKKWVKICGMTRKFITIMNVGGDES